MANNKSIQFLRKQGAPTTGEIQSLLPGQPLVDFANKALYIGTPTSASDPTNGMIKIEDTRGFYSADRKPPYPVTSVNGKTGAVSLTIKNINVFLTQISGAAGLGSTDLFLNLIDFTTNSSSYFTSLSNIKSFLSSKECTSEGHMYPASGEYMWSVGSMGNWAAVVGIYYQNNSDLRIVTTKPQLDAGSIVAGRTSYSIQHLTTAESSWSHIQLV